MMKLPLRSAALTLAIQSDGAVSGMLLPAGDENDTQIAEHHKSRLRAFHHRPPAKSLHHKITADRHHQQSFQLAHHLHLPNDPARVIHNAGAGLPDRYGQSSKMVHVALLLLMRPRMRDLVSPPARSAACLARSFVMVLVAATSS